MGNERGVRMMMGKGGMASNGARMGDNLISLLLLWRQR